MALSKKLLFTTLITLSFGTSLPNFLQDLLPKYKPEHFQKLIAEDATKAWHARLVIGFVGGFCTNAFCSKITTANILGIPSTAVVAYWTNNYAPIITQQREWLDIASAYLVGALAGRLARAAYQKTSEKFRAIFDKPEARVVLTERSSKEN